MQIKMAPGSVINLHDHRHYNGVLIATQGARLRKQTDKGTQPKQCLRTCEVAGKLLACICHLRPEVDSLEPAAGPAVAAGEDF